MENPGVTPFQTLDDFSFAGKRVLVRVDLNVPVLNGKISDTTRIERFLPTLREITAAGGKAILLSHFGRPGGHVESTLSLSVTTKTLCALAGTDVTFVATNWRDVADAEVIIAKAKPGTIILMENTRFHPGEEQNAIELARRMASLGDLYINDAFSAAHRAHASTEALAHLLPSAAGRAMQAELDALQNGLGNAQKPLVALVGGAKVSSKIDLLENLITRVDALVVGGGMANTFLHANGIEVGKSLVEKELAATARAIMHKAGDAHCTIILPIDVVVAWHFKANAPHRLYGVDSIDPAGMILDIGPASVQRINDVINDAKTLIWNGPLGAFEFPPFDQGTLAVARHAASRTKENKLVSVAGGGDTVAALNQGGVQDDFTYVSTAGGAFLEWMEGKTLPGVQALIRP